MLGCKPEPLPATIVVDDHSYCATHSMTVRSIDWMNRWTDDEIKWANAHDQEVVDHCFSTP